MITIEDEVRHECSNLFQTYILDTWKCWVDNFAESAEKIFKRYPISASADILREYFCYLEFPEFISALKKLHDMAEGYPTTQAVIMAARLKGENR